MRGRDLSSANIEDVMNKLKAKEDLLISPNKKNDSKRDVLEDLEFKVRGKHNSLYLEEDVQAFLIREILSGMSRDLTGRIAQASGFSSLEYLTSEFELSEGSKDRVDVLCCDSGDPYRIIVIELKKIRSTHLEQTRYLSTLLNHKADLMSFINNLTGKKLDPSHSIDIQQVYLMPYHPDIDQKKWEKIASKNGVKGILFYNSGFSSACMVNGYP